MIFKSIFEDSKVSYLIETKGLPIAFAQVLRISQLYKHTILTLKSVTPDSRLRPDETRFLHYSGMDLTYVQILFGIN